MGTLIDTNVLIDIERARMAGRRPRDLPPSEADYMISAISVAEMQIGIENARDPFRRDSRTEFLEDLLADFEVVPIDTRVAIQCGKLMARLMMAKPEQYRDPWIAATALVHGHAVLTGNLKHFEPVPGLTLIPWAQEA